jgi:ATP-dependent DNA ligase
MRPSLTARSLCSMRLESRPSMRLKTFGSSKATVVFFGVYALILAGRDRLDETFEVRRERLEKKVLPCLSEPDPAIAGIHAVRLHGLEGLVAKRRDSRYESGEFGSIPSVILPNWLLEAS